MGINIFLICVGIASIISLYIGVGELCKVFLDDNYIPKEKCFYIACTLLIVVVYWHAFILV